MKILLSAYACNPKGGGEARLGWRWAWELARRGHEVWVLLREDVMEDVAFHLAQHGKPANLHLSYLECRAVLPLQRALRARFRYVYYYFWQWSAYRRALELQRTQRFDLVHHVTWVQYRAPSFLGRLGVPFVFGPVAGGENTPRRLRAVLGFRQRMLEGVRDAWTILAMLDPMLRRTLREAARVLVTTPETLNALPPAARGKARIQLAIAHQADEGGAVRPASARGARHFLFVGRFLGWKGMALGIRAFRALLVDVPDARLTMVGDGPARAGWRRLAESLGVSDRIEWIDWLPHDRLGELYQRHDVLLFPSLHDSGGLVVLEAMTHGLPVVCLKLGGPGVIVDDCCGIAVDAAERSADAVIDGLRGAMLRLACSPADLAILGQGAVERAAQFGWDALIDGVYGDVPGMVAASTEIAGSIREAGT